MRDRVPRDLAAARLVLLDRAPERHALAAGGDVLDVDDEERRMGADARGPAEPRRLVAPLLLRADDAGPRPPHACLLGSSRAEARARARRGQEPLYYGAAVLLDSLFDRPAEETTLCE